MNKAEFDRLRAALNAVLDDHLGPPPDGKFGVNFAANNIIVPLLTGNHDHAMIRKQELDKLDRLNRAAREFASAWRGLHFDARREIERSGETYFDDNKHFHPMQTRLGWMRFWNTVQHLDKMIGVALPKARGLIDAAPEVGRNKMRAIKIIDTLRDTWEHRKGKPAPKNILNEDVAFYRFVDAVFTAVGLNRDVRGTMQAWLKFKKKYPDALRSGYRVHSELDAELASKKAD
jgi:hypothetical protein